MVLVKENKIKYIINCSNFVYSKTWTSGIGLYALFSSEALFVKILLI